MLWLNSLFFNHILTSISKLRSRTSQWEQLGNRFWIEKFQNKSGTDLDINDSNLYNVLKQKTDEHGLDISKLEVGMAILPKQGKLIPIHGGKLQFQHKNTISSNEDDIILCGFFPRANHLVHEHDNRPMDEARFHALNKALLTNYGINKDDIINPKYEGTSPYRIYRSFIYPKVTPNYLLDPIEKAANRTATQIDLSLRQIRADDAEYLRNVDKEIQTTRDIQPVAFLLDNLRSAFNVGSIFRTSETGGVQEIITVGITPHPPNPKLRKTAFTSMDVVNSTHFEDIIRAIEYLKSNGYTIVAMETTEKSHLYTDVTYPEKVVLVLGNELTGVDPRVLEVADYIVEIPTYGVKNSLNVASAAPIVLYEVLRQYQLKKKTKSE